MNKSSEGGGGAQDNHHQNNSPPKLEGLQDIWENAPIELHELRDQFSRLGASTHLRWKPTEFYDNLFRPGPVRGKFLKELLMTVYSPHKFWTREDDFEDTLQKCFIAMNNLGYEATESNLYGKGDLDDNLDFWNNVLVIVKGKDKSSNNASPETIKPTLSHRTEPLSNLNHANEDHQQELVKTSSWETTSFSELPDIHGDHVHVNVDGGYTVQGSGHHKEPRPAVKKTVEKISMEESEKSSALTKFDAHKKTDFGNQVGITAWDWLTRLEQLLVHFFLIIFDTTADSSKLMMDMMPKEASSQIEEIFKLLLEADPEMYKELGHIVNLAEQWLLHWGGGDADKKSKAVEFVRLYLVGIKGRNHYNLPVEVRLRQLGAFIAGLKTIENDDGLQIDLESLETTGFPQVTVPSIRFVPPRPLPAIRPPSPRVKPATHFARVVASILCDIPCSAPLKIPDVYAHGLGKVVFDNPLHSDQRFQSYIDDTYGKKYRKGDIFKRAQLEMASGRPQSAPDGSNGFSNFMNFNVVGQSHVDVDGRNTGSRDQEARTRDKDYHEKRNQGRKWSNPDVSAGGQGSRDRGRRRGGSKDQSTQRSDHYRGMGGGIGHRNYPGAPGGGGQEFFNDANGGYKHRLKNYPRRGEDGDGQQRGSKDREFGSSNRRPARERDLRGSIEPESDGRQRSKTRGLQDGREWNRETEDGNRPSRRQKGKTENGGGAAEWRSDQENGGRRTLKDRGIQYQEQGTGGKRFSKDRETQVGNSQKWRNEQENYNEMTLDRRTGGRRESKEQEVQVGSPRLAGRQESNAQRSSRDKAVQQSGRDRGEMDARQTRRDNQDPQGAGRQKMSKDQDAQGGSRRWSKDGGEFGGKLTSKGPETQGSLKSSKDIQGQFGGGQRSSKNQEIGGGNRRPSNIRDRELRKKSERDFRSTGVADNYGRESDYNNKRAYKSQADIKESRKTRQMFSKSEAMLANNFGDGEDGQTLSKISRESSSTPNVPGGDGSPLVKAKPNSKKLKEKAKKKSNGIPDELRAQIALVHGIDPVSLIKDPEISLDSDYLLDDLAGEGGAIWRKMIAMEDSSFIQSAGPLRAGGGDASKRHSYIGCPASLWGKLPIPCDKLFTELPPKESICCNAALDPFSIPSKSVLMEDTTGALDNYAEIPGNIQKYKQIFRDEARTKGLPRPSTAEVTNRLIQRTSKVIKKRLDKGIVMNELEYVPGDPTQPTSANNSGVSTNETNESDGIDSSADLLGGDSSRAFSSRNKSKSFIMGSSKDGGMGRKSSLKGIKKYSARKRRSFIHEKELAESGRKTQDGEAQTHPGSSGDEVKPRLSLTENDSSPSSQAAVNIFPSETDPMKLPPLQNMDEQDDMLSDTVHYSGNSITSSAKAGADNASSINKGQISMTTTDTSLQQSHNTTVRTNNNKHLKHNNDHSTINHVSNTTSWIGQGDQLDDNAIMNPCWEMVSKLFKSPLKAPAIPLPDNLLAHIEKKFPLSQWPRGSPIALRYYPTGQPFCVVFKNGAGRVHYPHGGLAVAISAPAQTSSRILVIRDPFDQFYFFDRAVMADLSCSGKGAVFDESGVVKVQYNPSGGYRQEGVGKMAQRWQWNSGGQRIVIKLNRYMALKIMDITKIYLVFYGNKRGVRLNVGAGRQVNLMSLTCDSSKLVMSDSSGGRPKSVCGAFDYARGRYNSTPMLPFLDNERGRKHHQRCTSAVNDSSGIHSLPQFTYSFSEFNNCNDSVDDGSHDCYSHGCINTCL